MDTKTLSAQEIERITVFRYAENFPLFEEDEQVVAYIIDPSTGKLIDKAFNVESAQTYILHEGMIGYAVGARAAEDAYWTPERMQRLFDTNRRQYVDCWT